MSASTRVTSPTKKAQQNPRSPLHVNLRTQQRRLRHVRSLSIRTLIPADPKTTPPLDIRFKFTLHRIDSSNIAIYESRCLQETYNPSWGSLLFDYNILSSDSVLSCFVVKVWQVREKDELLCFEKFIDLRSYVYLGQMMIRRENTGYPPNSIIIGMAEGYYVDSKDGGFPSPRRPSFHKIMEYLPPQSLIEVKRTEVQDSYSLVDLRKLLNQQAVLNKLRANVTNDKEQLKIIRTKSEMRIVQREESVELRTRCQLLRKQIENQKSQLVQERAKLIQLKEKLDKKEEEQWKKQCNYKEVSMKFDKNKQVQSQKRELLVKTQRKMYLRQRVMIAELAETYCIREMNGAFTICGVILPNGDPTESAINAEQISVALGFVTHLVDLLARFLLMPLQYTLRYSGSRSLIIDNVHDEQSSDFKEFPLYVKGADKSMFQFGLYLLWRDIIQLRQHCGYGNAKGSIKKTLPNLKSLLDRLVKDRYSISPLSEMSPPSISITGPTVINPSPHTSSYYSPDTNYSMMSRDSMATIAYNESPGTKEDLTSSPLSADNMIHREGSDQSGSIEQELPGAPMVLRRSPQIRRHKDGFVLKESSSPPRSPNLSMSNTEDNSFSQSPPDGEGGGALYSFNISRPLSNVAPAVLNLKSTEVGAQQIYSCSTSSDTEGLPFIISPCSGTDSPRLPMASSRTTPHEFGTAPPIIPHEFGTTSTTQSDSRSGSMDNQCITNNDTRFGDAGSNGQPRPLDNNGRPNNASTNSHPIVTDVNVMNYQTGFTPNDDSKVQVGTPGGQTHISC